MLAALDRAQLALAQRFCSCSCCCCCCRWGLLCLQVLAFGGGLRATIEDGSISDSLADFGVVVLANSTLTVRHTNFTGNTVMKGSLYASWASQIDLRGVTFRGNEASDEGAGVYVVGARAGIADCTFDSNTANGGGAAAYIKFSNVSVRASSISNNTAPTGGALGVYDGSSVTFEQSCNLTDNTARILAGTVTDIGSNYKRKHKPTSPRSFESFTLRILQFFSAIFAGRLRCCYASAGKEPP
jgi:hypothetical protein